MICYLCDSKEGVIRLAGPYVSQRFNVCRKCLKKAIDLKPGNQLKWTEKR